MFNRSEATIRFEQKGKQYHPGEIVLDLPDLKIAKVRPLEELGEEFSKYPFVPAYVGIVKGLLGRVYAFEIHPQGGDGSWIGSWICGTIDGYKTNDPMFSENLTSTPCSEEEREKIYRDVRNVVKPLFWKYQKEIAEAIGISVNPASNIITQSPCGYDHQKDKFKKRVPLHLLVKGL